MRTGFLWSLLNLTGGAIKQHVVIQTPPTIQNHRLLLEDILSDGLDPHYETRKLIRFSSTNNVHVNNGVTTIPLRSIYEVRGTAAFPPYHLYTRSHFLQFTRSPYASVMEYAEFCKMEDKLSHIINQYLEDPKNHWVVMMDDPFLMGAVRGYGTSSSIVRNSVWITTETTPFSDMLLFGPPEDPSRV